MLSDGPAAIAAWKQRLEDDPADERALEALDRLYERPGEWRALVEILRARERAATDKSARRTFMVRAAGVPGRQAHRRPEAILAYRAVIDDFGADKATLGALEQLYGVAERWSDLAETLEAHLGLADTDDERLGLLARLGDVRQTKIGDLSAGLEAYSRALAIDGEHAPSRAALQGCSTKRACGARRRRSSVLSTRRTASTRTFSACWRSRRSTPTSPTRSSRSSRRP